MGMRINNNVSALEAQRNVTRSSGMLNRAMERMSSGLRINRAADDAAGLAISESMASRIRQAQTESRNYQDAINMAQTAEGGLEQQQGAVQRIRDLAVQASNGTLRPDDRQALNAEAQQLMGQIDDVSQNTQFNDQRLLDQNRSIPVGAEGGVQVQLNESTNSSLGMSGLDLSTVEGARAAVGTADDALSQLSQDRSLLGSQMNRFERAINVRETQIENEEASRSFIRDMDMARASMQRTQSEMLLQAGLSALGQANVSNRAALSLIGQ